MFAAHLAVVLSSIEPLGGGVMAGLLERPLPEKRRERRRLCA